MAGYAWFVSFLEGNPAVFMGQTERLSLPRAQEMNKEEVHKFFKMLEVGLNGDNLLNKLQRIFNFEESGIQLIK
jgi:hypothetical protein